MSQPQATSAMHPPSAHPDAAQPVSPDGPHVRIQMLSNPLYLSGAREMVASIARRLGFPEHHCSQIALAVDEALCNVIRHGYERQADRPIWLSVWPLDPTQPAAQAVACGCTVACTLTPGHEASGIRIVIEDEAKQVDPSTIKSRNLDEIRPGGLGVHIIREVMDDVVYEHRGPIGMRLTMTKKRPAPEPQHAGSHP